MRTLLNSDVKDMAERSVLCWLVTVNESGQRTDECITQGDFFHGGRRSHCHSKHYRADINLPYLNDKKSRGHSQFKIPT